MPSILSGFSREGKGRVFLCGAEIYRFVHRDCGRVHVVMDLVLSLGNVLYVVRERTDKLIFAASLKIVFV